MWLGGSFSALRLYLSTHGVSTVGILEKRELGRALSKRRPGTPLVLRGDRIISAAWGTLDPEAPALPAGAQMVIATASVSVCLSGPLTASAVLDANLETERREPLATVYPAAASDYALSVRGRGFVG